MFFLNILYRYIFCCFLRLFYMFSVFLDWFCFFPPFHFFMVTLMLLSGNVFRFWSSRCWEVNQIFSLCVSLSPSLSLSTIAELKDSTCPVITIVLFIFYIPTTAMGSISQSVYSGLIWKTLGLKTSGTNLCLSIYNGNTFVKRLSIDFSLTGGVWWMKRIFLNARDFCIMFDTFYHAV